MAFITERRAFMKERAEKLRNLQAAYYRTGYEKLCMCRHSRKRCWQIRRREARHLGIKVVINE